MILKYALIKRKINSELVILKEFDEAYNLFRVIDDFTNPDNSRLFGLYHQAGRGDFDKARPNSIPANLQEEAWMELRGEINWVTYFCTVEYFK